MPPRNRYFSEDDTEVGVTRSQLKRLGRAKQLFYMQHWFETYYEDPAQETPRDDGEFLYIWGGPYDARDELGDEFGGLVSDERMEEAVDLVQRDGVVDWAPTSRHPIYQAALEKDSLEDEPPDDEPEAIDEALRRLEGGFPVSFGSPEDLAQREVVSRHLTALRKELASLPRSAPGIGHNGAPDDEGVPSVLEVEASIAEIGSELDKAEPDAVTVASATSRIARAGKWLRARVEKVAEKAVEDAIRIAGWGTLAFGLSGKVALPDLMQSVTDSVLHWIHVIGALF